MPTEPKVQQPIQPTRLGTAEMWQSPGPSERSGWKGRGVHSQLVCCQHGNIWYGHCPHWYQTQQNSAKTRVEGTGSLTSLCGTGEWLGAPALVQVLPGGRTVIPTRPGVVLCKLFLGALDGEQLLCLFGEVPAPECKAVALSKPQGKLQSNEGLGVEAGHITCSNRCCFRRNSLAT